MFRSGSVESQASGSNERYLFIIPKIELCLALNKKPKESTSFNLIIFSFSLCDEWIGDELSVRWNFNWFFKEY
jgi:hypothetical protein